MFGGKDANLNSLYCISSNIRTCKWQVEENLGTKENGKLKRFRNSPDTSGS